MAWESGYLVQSKGQYFGIATMMVYYKHEAQRIAIMPGFGKSEWFGSICGNIHKTLIKKTAEAVFFIDVRNLIVFQDR